MTDSSQTSFHYETAYWKQGLVSVAGCDEVGRGCLAGPVTAAAVVFAPDQPVIEGLTDSKKLRASKREELYESIKHAAVQYAIAMVDVDYINEFNILNATLRAMQEAVEQLSGVEAILVDGIHVPEIHELSVNRVLALPKGDGLSLSIAAASVLAKVERNRLMQKLHQQYPHYGWETNMGYGTKAHVAGLLAHGPTPLHRRLFVKTVMNKQLRLA